VNLWRNFKILWTTMRFITSLYKIAKYVPCKCQSFNRKSVLFVVFLLSYFGDVKGYVSFSSKGIWLCAYLKVLFYENKFYSADWTLVMINPNNNFFFFFLCLIFFVWKMKRMSMFKINQTSFTKINITSSEKAEIVMCYKN